MRDSTAKKRNNRMMIGTLFVLLVLFLTFFQLIFTFRGLDQPAAMDQAQIAREVARGHGLATRFLRPIDVMEASAKNKANYNPLRSLDTTYAPLNILAEAVALKVTGADMPEAVEMKEDSGNVYWPDRIVAGLSSIFFLVALTLAFFLLRNLFDELIASLCVLFMALSNLFLQFAASGLPQMLMLCFFLAACRCLLLAVEASRAEAQRSQWIWICAASAFMAALCLTGWLGVWPFIGFLLFIALYFRPYGLYSLPAIGIFLLCLSYFLLRNESWMGGYLGNAVYGIYNCFGSGEEGIMRAVEQQAAPLQASDFILKLLGFSLAQMNNLYVNLGSIIVTPFFFLSLFHTFKKPEVQAMKWATLAMWIMATLGMTLYGTHEALSIGQLQILFTPLMAAYGLAIVLVMVARLKVQDGERFVRNLILFALVLVSSGPFLFRLPGELHIGLWTSDRGIPHWPPYYPPALAGKLNQLTDENRIVMTDQPWAVAWYADRPALWIPKSIDDLEEKLMPVFRKAGTDIQGIVISPVSHAQNGMSEIISRYGDFAPLVMEGTLLALSPNHNFRFVELFQQRAGATSPLASWVSNSGRFDNITSLLGAQLLYYSKKAPSPAL